MLHLERDTILVKYLVFIFYNLDTFENSKVIALDRDPDAFKRAKILSLEYPNRITPLIGEFGDIENILSKNSNFSSK